MYCVIAMVRRLIEVPTNFVRLSFFLSIAATINPTPEVRHEKYIAIVTVDVIERFAFGSRFVVIAVAIGYEMIEKKTPQRYSHSCDSQNEPILVRDSLAMLAIAENTAITNPAMGATSQPFALSPEGILKRKSPKQRKPRDIHDLELPCFLIHR